MPKREIAIKDFKLGLVNGIEGNAPLGSFQEFTGFDNSLIDVLRLGSQFSDVSTNNLETMISGYTDDIDSLPSESKSFFRTGLDTNLSGEEGNTVLYLIAGKTDSAIAQTTVVTCEADVSSSLNNTHFMVKGQSADYTIIWFNVGGAGSNPRIGKYTEKYNSMGQIEVAISANDTASTVASAVNTAINASAATFSSSVSSEVVTIVNDVTGSGENSHDSHMASTGFLISNPYKGMAADTNFVKVVEKDRAMMMVIPLTTTTSEFKTVSFTNRNGVIRVSDGTTIRLFHLSFAQYTNSTGYIGSLEAHKNIPLFKDFDNKPMKSTMSASFGVLGSSDTMYFTITTNGSHTSWNGIYHFYYSYVTVDGQEGELESGSTTFSANGDVDSIDISFSLGTHNGEVIPYNVKSIKVYMRLSTSTTLVFLKETILADYVEHGSTDGFVTHPVIEETITDPVFLTDTYQGETGLSFHIKDTLFSQVPSPIDFKPIDEITLTGFKHATLANVFMYVAVTDRDEFGIGDTIWKSYANKPDIYTEFSKLTVSPRDGDTITAVDTYSDRLIIWKLLGVYIINISQEIEFIEDYKKDVGINYDYQKVITSLGAFWINNSGLYYYNGESVLNLITSSDSQLIDKDYWEAFITDNSFIEYDTFSKKVTVYKDKSSSDQDCVIFNMTTSSFEFADSIINVADFTTPIQDYDRKLLYIDVTNNALKKFSGEGRAGTASLISHPMFLSNDEHGLSTFYGIRFEYKLTSGAATFTYSIDGGANYRNFSGSLSASTTEWTHLELSSNVLYKKGVRNVILKLGTIASVGLEVKDVSLIVRNKNVR